MQVTVTFRHMESSDAVRDYAAEKTRRVEKYLTEPIDVHWILSVEKIRHIADVTITANSITIRGEEQTEDMYSAIDLVMNKLEKQMRKYKEKIKSHKPRSTSPVSARLNVIEGEGEGENFQPRIIRTENYSIKPMSLEEAVMQIDLLNNNFLVFTDIKSDNINVLYRRKDGNYGLIEPPSAK